MVRAHPQILGEKSKQAPLKVLHVITGLDTGGAESQLERVVINSEMFENVVVSLGTTGKIGARLIERGTKVYCLNMRFSWRFIFSLRALIEIVKLEKPDVVQTLSLIHI